MKNKILTTFSDNWEFKILAVVLAFVMWLFVYNTADPITTKQFRASVTITNENAVTEDKYYEVLNGSNSVSFVVSAKRSILDKLDDSSFIATADLKKLVPDETGEKGTVAIEILPSKTNYYAGSYNVKGKKYLEVSIEQKMNKSFNITVETKGELKEGYVLGNVNLVNLNILRVAGPASVVETIKSVVATIDIDGWSQDGTDNLVIPTLYDENGDEIDTTRLKLSTSTVTVSVQVLGTKEIPISFKTTGEPAGDNKVLGIKSSPSKVTVKGTASALNGVNSIDVPASVLDITDITENLKTTVDITQYLPEGVSLVNDEDANVAVEVQIRSYGSKTMYLSTDNITVEGLADDYEVIFEKSNVEVAISGAEDDLAQLDILKGKIDVSSLAEGEQTVVVTLNIDGAKYTYDTVSVTITIRKKVLEDNNPIDDGDDADVPDPDDGDDDTN